MVTGLVLLQVLLTLPDTGTGVITRAEPPHALVFASIQTGLGAVGEDATALVRPRVGVAGSSGQLVLSAPLWLRVADRTPVSDTDAGGSATGLMATNDPELYLGFLERFTWQSTGGGFRLALGPLANQRLGHGALVDQYDATIDPAHPRTGARVDGAGDLGAASFLIDSFVVPHLVAGTVAFYPLDWGGLDPERRLRTRLEAAVDPNAPGRDRQHAVGGADLDLSYAIARGEQVGLEIYTTAVLLSRPAVGAHLGVQLELAGSARDTERALVARVEMVAADEGYQPGYFDHTYSVERSVQPATNPLPKAQRAVAAATGLRGAIDAQWERFRFGISVLATDPHRPGALAIHFRVQQPRWSVGAEWVAPQVSRVEHLWQTDAGAFGHLETAFLVRGGWFLFGHIRRGWWRVSKQPPALIADWVVGLGYGAEDGQNPG